MTGNRARRNGTIARWLGGTALAGALMAAAPALAQVNATGSGVFGTGGIANGAGTTTVTVTAAEALVDWTATDADVFLPETSTLLFTTSGGPFTVLNRITPVAGTTNPLAIDGFVQAQWANGAGNVWFYNPNGFVIGGLASFDVNGLVLSASPIQLATDGSLPDFGTPITFGQAVNPTASVTFDPRVDGNISLFRSGSYLAVVAPRIEQNSDISVNGPVAFVAAEAATMTISAGLFDIAVDVGTTDPEGIVHSGSTGGPQPVDSTTRMYFVAVPKNDALTMLLSGNIGYAEATTVDVNDGRIVLSAGYDIVAGEAGGTATAGASMTIDALTASSAIDGTASDTVTISDQKGPVTFVKETGFAADNLIDVEIGYTALASGFNLDADSLDLISGNAIDIDFFGGSSSSIGRLLALGEVSVDALVDGGSTLLTNELALASLVTGAGAVTAGDVTLTVGDAYVEAFQLDLISVAYSDTLATGGTVTLQTASANAQLDVFEVANVWSFGFGNSGNADGATGVGGTAQVLVPTGQMNLGLDSGSFIQLDVRADGGPGVGTDAAGTPGSAQGGTALVSVSGGDLAVDDISVSASGLSYTLDVLNDFTPFSAPQPGDGTSATGGTATVSVSGGTLDSIGLVEGADVTVTATGFGGAADGTATTAGIGGAGQGGTAQYLQTGGDAHVDVLTVDASGMGGAGSPRDAKNLGPAGAGGTGTGGTALVQLSGGNLLVDTSIDVLALGNPRVTDPISLVEAGIGGSSTSGPAGTGGLGTGGDASLIVDGGNLLAATDVNGAQLQPVVTISAEGFGGPGGGADPSFATVPGGTGGDGQGGDALYEYSGGTNQAAQIVIAAGGTGGVGGADLSVGGQYGGADGGSGFGGTATFRVLADYDTTALGLGFDQFVTLDVAGIGADGTDAVSGAGGDGGDGTGGDAEIVADGAALTIGGLDISAEGNGGAGGSGGTLGFGIAGGDGGDGTGGSARVAAINGGSVTDLAAFDFLSANGFGGFGGNAGTGPGGDGGSGFGGLVTLDALGGDLLFNSLFTSASGFSDGGGFGTVPGTAGAALGGTIAFNATIVGADIGSLQTGALSAVANGSLVETVIAGGTITLSDSTSGAVTFDSLFFDNGYDAGVAQGAITVTSTLNPIVVAGSADFYTSGDLTIAAGGTGGFTADTIFAVATGDINILCLSAGCTGSFFATTSLDLASDGAMTVDGLDFGSDGATTVVVSGGNLTLAGGATGSGVPLDVNVAGSLLGDGILSSTGDLGLSVTGDNDIGALLTTGQLVQSGAQGAPAGTVYTTPGTFNVGTLQTASDTSVDAGTSIAIGDAQTGGNALTLFAPGAVGVDTVSNVSDVQLTGGSVTFGAITASGTVGLSATDAVTGGSVDAGGDISVFAGGTFTATDLVTGASIFIFADAVAGLDSLVAPLDITVVTTQDQTFASIDAGQNVSLSAFNGAITVADLAAGGSASFDALSLDITASGGLAVDSAFAFAGDIVITTAGDLSILYGEASGDIVLTSTGGGVAATDLYAGSTFVGEGLGGSQGLQAVTIPTPGAGNIAINAATFADLIGTVSAVELLGVDAGGTATVLGNASGRLIFVQSADLTIGGAAQLGSLALTDDVTLIALGDAALGSGVVSPGYLLDGAELARIGNGGDFSLTSGGTLAIGDATVLAGVTALGSAGTMTLTAPETIMVGGDLLLDSAGSATLVLDAGGDLLIDSTTGSVRMRAGGVQAGSLFLYGDSVVAGSDQTLSDIATLDPADLTDALGIPDGGDGRSLIEGGSILVDASEFYVVNTGVDDSFAARRGILADDMTVVSSAGGMPFVVINGVVDGTTGLETAFRIGFPASAAPYSSVNGCYISFGGQCGGGIENELVKKIISEPPPHDVLDGEPRSTIETRIVTIDNLDPEGFEPLIDEPVTGTGNDDLWADGLLDGKQCPVDVREDECDEEDGEGQAQ